ncbi:hypothetical protein [Paractinoplanes globisporus]|uniref:Uncharacterized protein n=1 Tax=Paractinoplanes globisporus TaxID=113565 RepID=A0ABW6W5K7_9ACTN|nr:hypothetical protein [Actinoplanes globisporus]
MPFTVHIDPDELAQRDLAAGLTRPVVADGGAPRPSAVEAGHRGARDGREAARGRSERNHARVGGGKSRSYAFRRS